MLPIKVITDETLKADVLDSPKVFFLAVGAEWCPDCRRAAPFFAQFANTYKDQAGFGAADSEKNPDIVEMFHVVNIPTMVAVKDGKEVDRIVEVRTPSELKAFIERNI